MPHIITETRTIYTLEELDGNARDRALDAVAQHAWGPGGIADIMTAEAARSLGELGEEFTGLTVAEWEPWRAGFCLIGSMTLPEAIRVRRYLAQEDGPDAVRIVERYTSDGSYRFDDWNLTDEDADACRAHLADLETRAKAYMDSVAADYSSAEFYEYEAAAGGYGFDADGNLLGQFSDLVSE